MPRKPPVGVLVTDMAKVAEERRPWTPPARRIPGKERLEARESEAGTRWCATCNTPLSADGASTFCKRCIAYRDRWGKKQRRLVKNGVIPLRRDINDQIVDAAEELEAAWHRLARARTQRHLDSEETARLGNEVRDRTLVLTGLIGEHLYVP